MPRRTGISTTVGASARREYERRSTRDKSALRKRLPVVLPFIAAISLIVGVGVHHFSPKAAPWAALVTAAAFIADLLGPRMTTVAFGIGSTGEVLTAKAFASLPDGFIAIHDRKASGYGGNVDHIVIGPTGVFVIESKSYSGRVRFTAGTLRINGRNCTRFFDQAAREAAAIRRIIAESSLDVVPIVCLHRAELPLLPIQAAGVRVLGPKDTVRLIKSNPAVLAPEDVRLLADLVASGTRPA